MAQAPFHEKRRHSRVEAQLRVRYHVLKSSSLDFFDDEGPCHDLGMGGMALELNNADQFEKEDILKIEILEGAVEGLRAYAEVAWCDAGRAGLRFMGVLEDDLERLRDLVQRRGEAHA